MGGRQPHAGSDVGSARTKAVIEAVQADGTCWAGITVWQGKTAMRISVSSHATTDQDVQRSLAAMLREENYAVDCADDGEEEGRREGRVRGHGERAA